MNDADVVAAIRANHLKANVAVYEQNECSAVHWDGAFVDPGGALWGPGPYLKVPVTLFEAGEPIDEIVIRVYPPAYLRRQLAKKWKPHARSTPL